MRVVSLTLAGLLTVPLLSAQDPGLRTRAEMSGYEETSRYDDVVRVVDGLGATSPLVHAENFGSTEEGRALPLLVVSDPRVTTPAEARGLGRPLVFVQANIHGGEVEGKEAVLALARRLVAGDLRPLTRQLVLLIAPIYNADGNEKISPQNRPSQNGPIAGVGTRENAKGLDLNRDYMKLESAEARALVGLLNRWDPHVVVDLHTTNGSYHGYHLTYAPILTPNADARLIAFSREHLLPAVQKAVLSTHRFRTYYYGNFSREAGGPGAGPRVDPARPGDTVWRTFDHRPRFGNNYVGLRNRLAILSEAYSYLDFKGRVDVTTAFVEETWRAVAANARRIVELTNQADRQLTTPSSRPLDLGVEFANRALPGMVDILVGDVRKGLNPRSGREMLQMVETATPVPMRDYGIFEATALRTLPRGWLIPKPIVDNGRLAAALERLRWHGITMRTVAADAQVPVERFVISEVVRAERPFQGVREARLRGSIQPAQLSATAGSIFVPANQRLGRLAFYLLEPESDDGLVTWNLIQDGLAPGEAYPIYRVTETSTLRLAPE